MNEYFNLTNYEQSDLRELMHYNKKFDGFNKVKLNWLDKLVAKEHKYGYNRMSSFGLCIICGGFLPLWLLFIWLFGDSDFTLYIGFGIHFIIAVILELLYNVSCDKIDYNALMDRNMQINIYDLIE